MVIKNFISLPNAFQFFSGKLGIEFEWCFMPTSQNLISILKQSKY